jgi:hypothetical protein
VFLCLRKIIFITKTQHVINCDVNFYNVGVVTEGRRIGCTSVANPTIASYNTSIVNFYNSTGSLARLKNKKYFIICTFKNVLSYYNAALVAVCKFKSRRSGSSCQFLRSGVTTLPIA